MKKPGEIILKVPSSLVLYIYSQSDGLPVRVLTLHTNCTIIQCSSPRTSGMGVASFTCSQMLAMFPGSPLWPDENLSGAEGRDSGNKICWGTWENLGMRLVSYPDQDFVVLVWGQSSIPQ